MQPRSSQKLQTRSRQQRHETIKSSFSAMKFQLLGNATLVDHIIRFNLCGAAEPEMVRNFCDRWRHYAETDEYRKARQDSQKCESDHVRRSKQIYHLREQVRRAEWVASWKHRNRTCGPIWTSYAQNSTTYCAHRQECAMREPGREWPTWPRLLHYQVHSASLHVVHFFSIYDEF